MYQAESGSESAERTCAYLRMWLTPGLGVRGAGRIMGAIGDPRKIELLSHRDLTHLGLADDVAHMLQSTDSIKRADEEWHRAIALGARIIDIDDPEYPPLLREISDPPLVLYVRGQLPAAAEPYIAIVGSRHPSPYGINCASRISRDLAERGVIVVSGLARGIDTAVHQGALAAGTTVGVLGTGVDRAYPSENEALADSMAKKGALMSEFPLGTLPLPQNFQRRNRILAGLALGTLVVEAAERSGSLITARLALEANREVFAIPGPIQSLKSRGCHQLIQQGACLVTGWEDIARELSPRVQLIRPTLPEVTIRDDNTSDIRSNKVLTPGQRRLLAAVSVSEDITLDTLSAKTSTPPSELYSAILALELLGFVRKLPGDRYIRNDPPP